MPDPRLVGLHDLLALIKNLNESSLRASSVGAHLSDTRDFIADVGDLEYIQTTIESDLVPRCLRILSRLQISGTLES